MQYRFRQTEIDEMKRRITDQCEVETITDKHGNKSAWRLLLRLEVRAYCCSRNKRDRERHERQIALYNSLTVNDMPNF